MLQITVLCIATLLASVTSISNNQTTIHRRRLQSEEGGVSSASLRGGSSSTAGDSRARYFEKKSMAKSDRMKRILSVINMKAHVVGKLEPEKWGAQHNPSANAIFAVLMNYGSMLSERQDALPFLGSLRKTGYAGDIVLAMSPGYKEGFLDVLKESKTVVYTIDAECGKDNTGEVCNYKGRTDIRASINMIRFFLYQFWTSLYDETSLLMVSDFSDVIFQSDPFVYLPKQWQPPTAQLAVFLEAYPNKVINRCPFNGGWIEACYGEEAKERIGTNTVSCSGVTMGTRNAMLVYTYLLSQQLDPKIRYGKESTKTNQGCISTGMDQGFHNHLIYSGTLDRYMDVKMFSQGEGPVNTVGALFQGELALLKFNLSQWKVLKGEGSEKYFSNWNGELSPVVHQYDRFHELDLKPHIRHHVASLQGLQW